ncbi:MAG TPA: EAL domain-containing protein [Epsilonproteobacteria bacterium]|nr:EAL domain-containing protein [Campylobacterota bacterium]
MKTYDTYFTSIDLFQAFLTQKHITDNPRLLIQIFTSLSKENDIILLRDQIHGCLPKAIIIGSTTDGEICAGTVSTDKTVISLTQFKYATLQNILIDTQDDSYKLGKALGSTLITSETQAIITFTDGLFCNGEDYLKGIAAIDNRVTVAGGMAGDNAMFKQTFIFTQNQISSQGAVGVSLNGLQLYLHTDYDFNGLSIGKDMTITQVDKNRVYTIDNIPIYQIYQHYLGEDIAKNLPEVGIEFPLIIQHKDRHIARAVLAKHDDGSLSFAGNFKQGDIVRFGYGNAEMFLEHSNRLQKEIIKYPIESIFVYSCMARRRLMPNLIEKEIKPFQAFANVSGFFTYGEFYSKDGELNLFNQTMTILVLSESSTVKSYKIEKDLKEEKFILNPYQKSLKALSHLLNTTTLEMSKQNHILEKKAQVLQAKKESLQRAQEVSYFGSWEIDLKSKKAIWSKESFNIYKLDPKTTQPTLDLFISMVVPEDRSKIFKTLEDASDSTIKTLEVRVKRADGEIITVLLNGKMLFNDREEPITIIGTSLDITEQVKLREYNKELASIIEDSSNEIYIIEKGTYQYLYVNSAALDKLGYTKEEIYQMNVLDISKEITPAEIQYLEQKLIDEKSIINRTIHTKKDGTTYPVQSYIQYHTYQNREVGIIFDIDISELVKAEQKQLQQSQILEQIQDSVVSTDLEDIITQWNHGAAIIHGYTAEEVVGKSIQKLYLPEDAHKLQWMKQQALIHGVFHDEIRKVTKSGNIIYTHVSISVLKDDKNEIIGLTRYSQDITHKKEIERKLEHQTELLNFQAYHDALTKLPNRILFEDRLEQSITNAHKHNEKLGLLFIDLDNFKQINDTLGHHYGDEVLQIVAKRLSSCIKKEDTLARLGGDEFTILIQDLKSSKSVADTAQRIIDSLQPKIVLKNHELHISASIGISLYPKDSKVQSNLFKYADTAMYKAKDEGRNNYQFYSEEMTLLAFEKAMMEINLRKAIDKEEFTVYYQPQIDARDNSIIGMEALVRWEHPEMGLIMPEKFIHVAEETNFIRELDYFVMCQAMSDIYTWYQEGLNPGILSLNLSIKQLMSNDFLEKLNDAIQDTHFNVAWLGLEITENQMMHDPIKSIKILNTLNEMGIKIAIDDFGTGYSSLTYLKRLPLKTLKIDQSFIKDLPGDEEDKAISKAIIALAKSLNLTIIAEGVESSAQIEYLLSNGCHYIQGHYYSKAISKDLMTEYMKNNIVVQP